MRDNDGAAGGGFYTHSVSKATDSLSRCASSRHTSGLVFRLLRVFVSMCEYVGGCVGGLVQSAAVNFH